MTHVIPQQIPPPLARLELSTQRLRLVAGDPAIAPAVRDYQLRNRAHFARWEPPAPESFYTVEGQAQRVQQALVAFFTDTAYRYWLVDSRPAGGARLPTSDLVVIGSIHFSLVCRGAFHSAMMGYSLDEAHVGQGLMSEALLAGIAEMFSPRVNLHRLQAAYQPDNVRSAAVLKRLGFEQEGYAPEYLYIAGAWRDHRITALRNPNFVPPDGW